MGGTIIITNPHVNGKRRIMPAIRMTSQVSAAQLAAYRNRDDFHYGKRAEFGPPESMRRGPRLQANSAKFEGVPMSKPVPQEAAIASWLAAQKEAMLALLADLVNIDSGSYDRAGVEAVGERLVRFLEESGLVIEREPHETFAPAIHVKLDEKRANEADSPMGHRDTSSQRRGGAAAFRNGERPSLWPCRRHEGGSHKRLRLAALQALRRPARARVSSRRTRRSVRCSRAVIERVARMLAES